MSKIYYIKGTGSLNSCTLLEQNINGNVRFESIFKLKNTHFVPWGICPDTGWGGPEDADCRFILTNNPHYYFDYGSFRLGPINASSILTALTQHKIKIEGSAFYIKVTDLDEDTVLINQTISSYGVPNGPWMLGTTSNLQFYEGKVWVGDTLTIDCKADATGLKNLLTNSYYTLNNVQYGNYDEIVDPVPSTDPQSNNSLSTFLGPLILRRRLLAPQAAAPFTITQTFRYNQGNRSQSFDIELPRNATVISFTSRAVAYNEKNWTNYHSYEYRTRNPENGWWYNYQSGQLANMCRFSVYLSDRVSLSSSYWTDYEVTIEAI